MDNRLAFYASASATILVVIVVTGAWQLIGFGGPGPNVGAWPLTMPIALVAFIVVWIVLRTILLKRIGWTALTVLGGSLFLGYLLTAAVCGPIECFQAEPNRYMGWYIVVGAVLAALLHHVTYEATARK